MPKELLENVWQLIKPGGMWYLTEILPQDMPASWVYRYFPSIWQWVKSHSWNLYALYNHLCNQGFHTEVKRHMFYQPITLRVVADLAERRSEAFAHISVAQYDEGMKAIQQEIKEKGDEYLLGSEFSVVEVWAQKPVEVGE
jgi:hypothetical protein